MDPNLLLLQETAGIHLMGALGFQPEGVARNFHLAQDAQPALVTVSNAGIPAYLTTYYDPKIINTLVSPMKAAIILGANSEVKKGDWTTTTAQFITAEAVGEVASYGDYSNNGTADANVNYPQRQAYHYQVITQWGEKQLAMAGLARIDWANQQSVASILILNKFQNKSYFFGVQGIQNYGLLNDPALYAPIAPTSEGGHVLWSDPLKDAVGVVGDVSLLFATLQTQSNGLLDLNTEMVLAMSPTSEANGMTKTNIYNNPVADLLKKIYPNLRIETAVEYGTASGQLVQLIALNIEGQPTAEPAFTEKLRAHPVVIDVSSFKQKKSQGTFGTVIYRPYAIASMLGV